MLKVIEFVIVRVGIKFASESSISNLIDLEELRIKENPIKSINLSIFSRFLSLKILDFSFNHIESISLDFGMSVIPNLKELGLAGNYFKKFDATILTEFKHLNIISLAMNEISKITENSFNSLSIKELDLSDQNFVSIDFDAIKDCEYLESIVLSNNMLERITPGFIKNSPRLRDINLFGNFIEELVYDNFGKLDNLSLLYLAKNHITLLLNQVHLFI